MKVSIGFVSSSKTGYPPGWICPDVGPCWGTSRQRSYGRDRGSRRPFPGGDEPMRGFRRSCRVDEQHGKNPVTSVQQRFFVRVLDTGNINNNTGGRLLWYQIPSSSYTWFAPSASSGIAEVTPVTHLSNFAKSSAPIVSKCSSTVSIGLLGLPLRLRLYWTTRRHRDFLESSIAGSTPKRLGSSTQAQVRKARLTL